MFLKTLQERTCRNWHQTELWDGEVIPSACSADLRSELSRSHEREKEITGSTELSLTSVCAPLPTVNKNRNKLACVFPVVELREREAGHLHSIKLFLCGMILKSFLIKRTSFAAINNRDRVLKSNSLLYYI